MSAKKVTTRKLGRGGKHNGIVRYESGPATLAEAAQTSAGSDIDGYERVAKAILQKAGLPTEYPKMYPQPDGTWKTITGLLADKPLTAEWYAAQILHWAFCARDHIKNGDAQNAVYAALRLQEKVCHLQFSQWEEYARIGQAQVTKAGHRDDPVYTAADKRRWAQRAMDLWQDPAYQRAGQRNVRKAARTIADETDAGAEAIRGYLYTLPN